MQLSESDVFHVHIHRCVGGCC